MGTNKIGISIGNGEPGISADLKFARTTAVRQAVGIQRLVATPKGTYGTLTRCGGDPPRFHMRLRSDSAPGLTVRRAGLRGSA